VALLGSDTRCRLTTGSTTLALRNSVEDIGNSTPAVKGALKNARIEADDGNIRSQ
jgi:hypothetical protein